MTIRKVNLIIIHCSASDHPAHDDISVIDQWHRARGWSGCGYHYFITKSGEVQVGRKENQIGAHAKGYNKNSIGICFSGEHDFTNDQFYSAKRLIIGILNLYGLEPIDIIAHNQVNKNKTCPNFDISKITKGLYLRH